jgi:hypothetical protein
MNAPPSCLPRAVRLAAPAALALLAASQLAAQPAGANLPPRPPATNGAPAAAPVPPTPATNAFRAPPAPVPARYQKLVQGSPFTTPPPPPVQEVPLFTFPELALIGVMDTGGGMLAVLQDKSSQEYIQLLEGQEQNGLKLLRVVEPQDPFRTRLEMTMGGQTGEVKFDFAQFALQPGAGAPKAAAAPRADQPAGAQQPNPGDRGSRERAEREQIERERQQAQQPPTVTPRRRIVMPR